MAQLSVELTADIDKLLRELNKAKGELDELGDISDDTRKRIQRSTARGAKAFGGLQKGVANATPTLQEFSRVIQDAPFGIQGIGNNITQLVSNFGNLQRATGGTGAALRLLLGSFAGPAGFLFVISTAVSLLTVFGDKLGTAKNRAKELKEELDRTNENFGASVALAESELKLLELQGKQTTEKRQQLIGILGAQAASLQAIQDQNVALLTQLRLQNQTVSNWEIITQAVGQQVGFIKQDLTSAYRDIRNFSLAAFTPLAQLLDIEVDRSIFTAATAKEKEKEAELTATVQSGQAAINKLLAKALELNQGITEQRQAQAKAIGAELVIQQRGITANLENIGAGVASQISGETLLQSVATPLTQLEALWLETVNNINDIGQNQLAPAISSVFNNVGAALAQGENLFSAFGRSLLGAFGQFLSQFGQQLVSYGVAALAFSATSKALLTPITAGPAAAAAIAIGAALSAAGAALSSTASGGLGGPSGGFGGSRVGGFTGANSSFSSGSFGGGGTVVFEIQGTKLVGVLNRTLSQQNRTLGNLV